MNTHTVSARTSFDPLVQPVRLVQLDQLLELAQLVQLLELNCINWFKQF